MKNDLTCAVARDLLPSYVEGLTAPETAAAVEAHLASCPDCAARREAMRAPAEAPAEEMREVDYLKKVKRRGWKRVLLAVVCTAAVIALCVAAKLFLIGEPASHVGTTWGATYNQIDQTLALHIHSVESAMAYKDWAVEREGDTVRVTARKVLVSSLYPSGTYETLIPMGGGIRTVYLGEDPIWQDGVVVYPESVALYRAKTPYLGDAAALGRLTERLGFEGLFGEYSHTLHTDQEPYGWTINFTRPADAKDSDSQMMRRWLAPQMLALVGNVQWISWTYQDEDGMSREERLTLEEINDALPQITADYNAANGTDWSPKASVKDYAETPGGIQMLKDITWRQMQLYFNSR